MTWIINGKFYINDFADDKTIVIDVIRGIYGKRFVANNYPKILSFLEDIRPRKQPYYYRALFCRLSDSITSPSRAGCPVLQVGEVERSSHSYYPPFKTNILPALNRYVNKIIKKDK